MKRRLDQNLIFIDSGVDLEMRATTTEEVEQSYSTLNIREFSYQILPCQAALSIASEGYIITNNLLSYHL
jgi:hypothetical protein